MAEYKHIVYEKDSRIAKVTMNRPQKLNAMFPEMEEELISAFRDCQKDDNIRVLVFTGTGRAFSSGEDVRVLQERAEQLKKASPEQKPTPTPMWASPIPRAMIDIVEKPVIASVNGVCAGAGYGLALASDIRIASENARFAHVYLRRALTTSCEVWFLPRLIGLGPAFYHILTADDMDAKEALRLNFVCKVVPQEKLEAETRDLALKIAERPPVATKFTKRAIYKGLLSSLAETMEFVGYARAAAAGSRESEEGRRAFLEKRKPVF
ncbi:MAG: enoyl-CoA hydratase/isomerase family protein [Chloroflexi bacterium]|nr:enoyl-CoA hydratase/isomerase family protein [Chloroflexota bacterium]